MDQKQIAVSQSRLSSAIALPHEARKPHYPNMAPKLSGEIGGLVDLSTAPHNVL